MAEAPSAAEEAVTLDRLLTRLALTENDNLEKVLAKLLPFTIMRLGSPHQTSRTKVMEMLAHINKRVREQPHIALPLRDLLALYTSKQEQPQLPAQGQQQQGQQQQQPPMVRNFALVYAEMAFERAPTDDQLAVLPQLLEGVAERSQPHADILLRCAGLGVEHFGSRAGVPSSADLEQQHTFAKRAADRAVWLDFCLLTLLYTGGSTTTPPSAPGQVAAAAAAAAGPPGLSPQQAQRVTGNAKQVAALRGDKLAARKLGMLNFCAALQLSAEELYPLCLVASTDSAEAVSRRGEELLKRRCASADLEQPPLVQRLFALYQGSTDKSGPPETQVSPASAAVRLKLLGAFTHSVASANLFPATLQIVFGSIYGADSTMRMKQAGMEFAVWTFKHAQEAQLKPVAPAILVGLLRLLEPPPGSSGGGAVHSQDAAAVQLRAFMYQAIGQLAQRCPHIFRGTAAMAVKLFGALAGETGGAARSSLQDCIVAVGGAYEGCTPAVQSELEVLLLHYITSEQDAARFCSVQWATRARLLPPTVPCGRYVCMLAAGDAKLEIREMAERGLFPVADAGGMLAAGSSDDASGTAGAADQQQQVPGVAAMLDFIVGQRPAAAAPTRVGEQALLFPSRTYEAMLRFLRRCKDAPLAGSKPGAGPGAEPGAGAEGGAGAMEVGEGEGEGGEEGEGARVAKHRALLEHAMARDGSWSLHAVAAEGLLELATTYPQCVGREYAGRLAWVRSHVAHSDAAVHAAMARLLGITAAHLAPREAAALLKDLVATFEGPLKTRQEEVEGAVEAAGYVLAQLASSTPPVAREEQEAGCLALCAALLHASPALQSSAAQAVGHVGLRGPLPLPPGDLEAIAHRICNPTPPAAGRGGGDEEEKEKKREGSGSRAWVLASLAALLQSKDDKTVQRAALALGRVAFGDRQLAPLALTALFGCTRHKAQDVLFAAGEALALIWGGIAGVTADTFLRTPVVSLTAASHYLAASLDSIIPPPPPLPTSTTNVAAAAAAAPDDAAPAAATAAAAAIPSGGGSAAIQAPLLHVGNPAEADGDVAMADAASEATLACGEGGGEKGKEEGEGGAERAALRAKIWKRVAEEAAASGRADERCAAAVWLLSLVTYCGRDASFQPLLPRIQDVFSSLLGDGNELTQEMASRGMSAVYDLGDAAMQAHLVQALVATLSGSSSKKGASKLVEDSEVAGAEVAQDGGAASSSRASGSGSGSSSGGGGVSTYRELCSLAADVGQPDLIYRFLDLANHQAALNSKRGTAYGLAKIAQQAGDALKPHMRVLVPRLVRYQYDPSRAIQDSMSAIWRALVAEPKRTIDEHYDAIMEDLLQQAGSRLWRSREASCLALADLLSSRRFSEVAPYLERLWVMAFRVVDDIKESVRTAGDRLCRAVSSLSIRLCDPSLSSPSEAAQACQLALPVLLSKGLLSSVGSVRKIALTTMSKLVKSAGPAVRPMVPDVACAMLEALSSLEDQTLNYAELHAERVGISSEKLESVRLSMARESPMWLTLECCLKHVGDAPTLQQLAPRLAHLVRTGTGLNTRVGVARFISQLADRVGPQELKPHVAALMKALYPALLNERSAAARRAWAAAAADVARCGGPARVQKLVADACQLYAGAEDRDARLSAGLLLRELARHAGDAVRADVAQLLPLSFLAKHDEDDAVKALFEEVWEDVSGSASAAAQLYCSEIAALVAQGLASSSWPRKQQSARSAVALAEVLGDSMPGVSVHMLLAALLAELPGRLWDGKEVVVEAVGSICRSCPTATSAAPAADGPAWGGPQGVVDALLLASERKKTTFRAAALTALLQVIESAKGCDVLDRVAPALLPALLQAPASSSSATSSEPGGAAAGTGAGDSSTAAGGAGSSSSGAVEQAVACLAASLQHASAPNVEKFAPQISSALAAVMRPAHPWHVRRAAADAAKKYSSTLTLLRKQGQLAGALVQEDWVQPLVGPLLACCEDAKYSQLRTAAAEALIVLVQLLRGSNSGEAAPELHSQVSRMLQVEKSTPIKALLQQLLLLLAGGQ